MALVNDTLELEQGGGLILEQGGLLLLENQTDVAVDAASALKVILKWRDTRRR